MKKKLIYSFLFLGIIINGYVILIHVFPFGENRKEALLREEKSCESHDVVRNQICPTDAEKISQWITTNYPNIRAYTSSSVALSNKSTEEAKAAISKELEFIFQRIKPEDKGIWYSECPSSLRQVDRFNFLKYGANCGTVLRCLRNATSYAVFMIPDTCIETSDCFYAWHHGYLSRGVRIDKKGLTQMIWRIDIRGLDLPKDEYFPVE